MSLNTKKVNSKRTVTLLLLIIAIFLLLKFCNRQKTVVQPYSLSTSKTKKKVEEVEVQEVVPVIEEVKEVVVKKVRPKKVKRVVPKKVEPKVRAIKKQIPAPIVPTKVIKQIKYSSHVEVMGLTNNQGRDLGMVNAFVPLKQSSSSIIFTDIRTQKDNKSSNEFNIGLGYRKLVKDHIWGAYAYYDRKRSSNGNFYNGLTVGGERLGEGYDFRLNFYLPENEESFVEGSDRAYISGSSVKVDYATETALMGTDFEVGKRVTQNATIFLGGEYYRGEDSRENSKYDREYLAFTRAEAKFFSNKLALGTKIGYNQDSDIESNIYARFRIPFGSYKGLTPMQVRMTDTVIRDADITVVDATSTVDGYVGGDTASYTGTPWNGDVTDLSDSQVIDVANLSEDDLAQYIEDNTFENQLIILSGWNKGPFTKPITPKAGQIIASNDLNIYYDTATRTKETDLDLGHTAALNFSNDTNVIEFTEDSHMSLVEDIDFFGGKNGIHMYLTNTDNITAYADDLKFISLGENGVYFYNRNSNNNTLHIGNLVIDRGITNGNGIYFNNAVDNDSSNASDNTLNVYNFEVMGNISKDGIMFTNNHSTTQRNTLNIDNFEVTGDIGENGIHVHNFYSGGGVRDQYNILDIETFKVVGDIGKNGIYFYNKEVQYNTLNINTFFINGAPSGGLPSYYELYINTDSQLIVAGNTLTINNRNILNDPSVSLLDKSNGAVKVTVGKVLLN